jgi:preprotein translocase subunit SecA
MVEKDTSLSEEDLLDVVLEASAKQLQDKVTQVGAQNWASFERAVTLQSIDTQWRGHLQALDHLRKGIHLRGYAQKDPKQEYKREAFAMFAAMLDRIRDDVVRVLLTVRIQPAEQQAPAEAVAQPAAEQVRYHHADYDAALRGEALDLDEEAPAAGDEQRVGRNDPCPCGSGKKYKHCHGKLD